MPSMNLKCVASEVWIFFVWVLSTAVWFTGEVARPLWKSIIGGWKTWYAVPAVSSDNLLVILDRKIKTDWIVSQLMPPWVVLPQCLQHCSRIFTHCNEWQNTKSQLCRKHSVVLTFSNLCDMLFCMCFVCTVICCSTIYFFECALIPL